MIEPNDDALINLVRKNWGQFFSDLNRDGPPSRFSPRQLAGIYAVASIYYYGNAYSPISDPIYDKLCQWIRDNFELCVEAGADKLDPDCSGIKVGSFVKPYHDIVGILQGSPCRCISCENDEQIGN